MSSFNAELKYHDLEFDVSGFIKPAEQATSEYPGSPVEVNITEVKLNDKDVIKGLSQSVIEHLVDECIEKFEL